MAEISRVALFGKLNSLGYKAIESATVFCKLRGNPYVELAHWLHQILQVQDSDLHRIIKQFDLNPSRLAKDLTDALDRLPRGSTSISDLSSQVEEATERGWVYGSLLFGESQNASFVGNNRVIFNIKGNDYRLVVAINYRQGIVYIRFVGSHQAYDRIDASTI